ncbi:MAG: hypothetical protein NZ924_05380 [Candidatus Bipolaricaulota bacterium]|nr:hypothetical protein [Candidatus Bipolaricaulota bacterium]MDW8152321.1 hypothetical protein [Candidatus Bipolaricaulota bacterium]
MNWAIKEIVKGIPLFPYLRETLAHLQNIADMVVVSQSPVEARERE